MTVLIMTIVNTKTNKANMTTMTYENALGNDREVHGDLLYGEGQDKDRVKFCVGVGKRDYLGPGGVEVRMRKMWMMMTMMMWMRETISTWEDRIVLIFNSTSMICCNGIPAQLWQRERKSFVCVNGV